MEEADGDVVQATPGVAPKELYDVVDSVRQTPVNRPSLSVQERERAMIISPCINLISKFGP